MRNWFRGPSPAMFVALIALVVAMSGVAVAAKGTIGGKDIKKNAIKTSKIKNGAVTGPKIAKGAVGAANLAPGAIPASSLADGSVTTPKLANGAVTQAKIANNAVTAAELADGAVTTGKLGDGSVTTGKLDPTERADAFRATHGQVALPAAADTIAIQTALPTPGDYMLTVSGEIGNTSGAANFIACTLLDANNPLANSGTKTDNLNTFQGTISLTGFSDGGTVRLSCNPTGGASIRNLVLSAVRVSSVTQLTSTP